MTELSKSEIKRRALVDATISLVNNNGFHATPISKIAKMADVSPATIYLYFENKQDLVNKVYIEVKEAFTAYAFESYSERMPVVKGFEVVWKQIAKFKTKQLENAMFLAQCDHTPIIDQASRQEGIKHLQPLLDLWQRGKDEQIIKPISDYLLYAYTINPLSFLIVMQQQGAFKIEENHIEEAYQAAWNSIKL
ncbi:TetR/AcrR family transcriptional regulator [Changchengzhania lutea]|uniref:TetR/AcrR family transcriptional regulator n=1 Tax=Changchengzhania lutea TaxID=2049305 RepID=UPI00115D010F|nr:TetR/AcrR family transcriptional regulator [Changchengzhania lutea]